MAPRITSGGGLQDLRPKFISPFAKEKYTMPDIYSSSLKFVIWGTLLSLRSAFLLAIGASRLLSSTCICSAFGGYISFISEDYMLNRLSLPLYTGFNGEILSFDSSSRLDSEISRVPVIS